MSVYAIISERKFFPTRLFSFTGASEWEWCSSVKEIGFGFCADKLGALRLAGAEKETPWKSDF